MLYFFKSRSSRISNMTFPCLPSLSRFFGGQHFFIFFKLIVFLSLLVWLLNCIQFFTIFFFSFIKVSCFSLLSVLYVCGLLFYINMRHERWYLQHQAVPAEDHSRAAVLTDHFALKTKLSLSLSSNLGSSSKIIKSGKADESRYKRHVKELLDDTLLKTGWDSVCILAKSNLTKYVRSWQSWKNESKVVLQFKLQNFFCIVEDASTNEAEVRISFQLVQMNI